MSTTTPRRTEAQKMRRREYESSPQFRLLKRAYDTAWERARGVKPISELKQQYLARIHVPSIREKARQTKLSRRDRHQAALVWSIRSPDGAVYRFKNLCCFIREHRELFSAEQLVPVNRLGRTRIEASLSLLSPRRKHCSQVAQGWTWHIDGKEPETYLL
jgi:hypothetical protein